MRTWKFVLLASIGLAAMTYSYAVRATRGSNPASCVTLGNETDSACIVAVDVEAGQTLELGANQNDHFVEGFWDADWGTIDQNGHYTAPTFLPPAGFDTVRFVTEDNSEYRTSFHIVPQPGTPFTIGPECLQPEDVYDERSEPINPVLRPQDDDEIVYHDWESPGVTEYVSESDYVTNDFLLDGVTDVAVIEGDSCAILPTRSDDDLVALVIKDSTSRQMRKKCAVLPKPSWANDDCTGSEVRAVKGPIKKSRKGQLFSVSMSISGETSGTRDRGTQMFFKQAAVAYWYKDFYKCVNGKWTYIKTIKCTIDGAYGQSFEPGGSVAARALGYSGDPGYKFNHAQDPNCTDY